MAIDTKQKRASAMQTFSTGVNLVIPGGGVTQGDRQQTQHNNIYRGILATGATSAIYFAVRRFWFFLFPSKRVKRHKRRRKPWKYSS